MSWLRKNKGRFVVPVFVSLLLMLSMGAWAQEPVLSVGSWQGETVAEGIILYRAAFDSSLFGANQYLCVLEVAPGARFDIVPAGDSTLEKTTALAVRSGAVAAVNGSFFNMKAPYGSVNYLRVDDADLAPNRLSPNAPGSGRTLQQGGAIATFRGGLYVLKGDDLRAWERYIAAEDVVTTGPVLIAGGEPEPVRPAKFNTDRHPRTAAGRRADGTVLIVVADGRSPQAAGLTMAELQQVMLELGCRDAINLDGGGSTAMVVRGVVVNHPSDNRQFDADGERSVANAIVVSVDR